MGTSTNGQLSFGVVFEEGFEFPWDARRFDGDISEWWRSVRGFANPHENPFDERGNYKPGMRENNKALDKYFACQREWDALNQLPIELVNHCSSNCPAYIIATKHFRATRGNPEAVDVAALQDTAEAERVLREFLDEFQIEHDGKIGWWLSSYWG